MLRHLARALPLLVLLVLTPGAGAATTPHFTAPVTPDIGDSPAGLVAADLNGDGKPDLATADEVSRSVSVLLGRGDGSFRPRRALRVPREPVDIADADLDADGDLDLATASADRWGSVAVLLNDGAGGFHVDHVYRAGAFGLAAADVNRDGIADLVAASYDKPGVVVLLGAGGGRFGAPRRFPGHEATDVALGDLNGDGSVDAVLAGGEEGPGDRVMVRLGAGDGTFGPETVFHTTPAHDDEDSGADPLGVTLADLNHDGRLDLAAATFYGAGVSVLLGAGDGAFGPATAYEMDRKPDTVVVADFDGDGNPDLATGSNDGVPAVRNGLGDGTFGKAHYLEWLFGSGGAAADFNLDGRPDLAFGRTEGAWANVFLNWTGLPEPPCVVVDVTGFKLREAKQYLGYGNCRLGHVRRKRSRKVHKGRVISQRPRDATVLQSRSRVDLVVSRGRRH
jgi:hypothetical protein